MATAFAIALETWDTERDTSPLDASRRAAVYAVPNLAAQLRSRAPPAPRSWATLAARHASTRVVTRLGGLGPQPADTAIGSVQAVTCAITDEAAGWHADGGDVAVVVYLQRSDAGRPWSVRSYQLTSL